MAEARSHGHGMRPWRGCVAGRMIIMIDRRAAGQV